MNETFRQYCKNRGIPYEKVEFEIMRRIGPQDLLAIGTLVQVGNERGLITKAGWALDQHQNPICSHEIKFTQRLRRVGRFYKWYATVPKTKRINYAFINIIQETS